MQLVAFRIQNFRSVVDTGWQQLAHDNITSLIGQNESGKTSILEALRAFHDGKLIEDMLRSDLSLPLVSCRFAFQMSDIENRIDIKRLDPRIRKLIGSLESISISRTWEDDIDSHMVMGDELQEIYNETYDQLRKREQQVLEKLENLIKEVADASQAIDKASAEFDLTREKVESVKLRINEIKRSGRKFSSKEKKEEIRSQMELEEEMLGKLKQSLEQKKTRLEEKQDILEALDEKRNASKKLEDSNNEIIEKKEELGVAQDNLRSVLQMTGMYPTDKEQRAAEIKEEILRNEIDTLKEEIEQLQKDYDTQLLALEFVFDGITHDSAVKSAEKEIVSRKKFYSSRDMAEEIFKIVPDFELFEDFSSLLPNRIDLEDIIRANKKAEGYKAAINFLTITGLEYSFFQQPSS
ncbi:MAG: AAA family ATPase, partial [Bacteroidales bacterium]|nr:AAA family ATPase [Bacteroidales bacterium]